MPRQMPTVRETNWLATVPHLAILVILSGVATAWTGSGTRGPMIGAACYLAWSIGGRYLLPRRHRRAVMLTRQQKWPEAEAEFEASYEFFQRNTWIDQFRSVVMLSASRASYREMALLNIATCQLQQKRVAEAKATYERTLTEFPGSPMAEAALETIQTVEAAADVSSDAS